MYQDVKHTSGGFVLLIHHCLLLFAVLAAGAVVTAF